MELFELTAREAGAKIAGREISARELTESVLSRIDQVEGDVHAFVTVLRESALAQADLVDQAVSRGESLSPVAGIPIAYKDNLSTTGIETTCSSKILRGYKPPYDATVVSKLNAAGAVAIGKANLDEFAMGSSTENSAFYTTRNPWNTAHVPGGSSGGSTAAVAASEALWSLGSDTGGSIRQPAAFCGVVGMKPTYGRVSRYGLIAFASSLDQIGPVTKDVYDNALLLNHLAGHDPLDSTSAAEPAPDFTQSLNSGVKGLRLGVPTEYYAEGVSEEVKTALSAAIGRLEALGASIDETSLPTTDYALACYYIIAPAEASSNLARYDGVRFGHRTERAMTPLELFNKTREEGFGPEVK